MRIAGLQPNVFDQRQTRLVTSARAPISESMTWSVQLWPGWMRKKVTAVAGTNKRTCHGGCGTDSESLVTGLSWACHGPVTGLSRAWHGPESRVLMGTPLR